MTGRRLGHLPDRLHVPGRGPYARWVPTGPAADVGDAMRSANLLAQALETLGDPWVLLESVRGGGGDIIDFVYLDANTAAVSFNRTTRDRLIGARLMDLFPAHGPTGLLARYAEVAERGGSLAIDDVAMVDAAGRAVRTDVRVSKVGDGISLIWRDMTQRYAEVAALAASEERFRVAMAAAPVGMVLLDGFGRLVQVNPAFCSLLGRSEDWLVGRELREVFADPAGEGVTRLADLLSDGPARPVVIEHRLVRADGSTVWVRQFISALHDTDGGVVGHVLQFADITQTREFQARLRALAVLDPLTSLLNRRGLIEQMDALMAGHAHGDNALAVLFIDLDGLKQVNDGHGHLVGDRVIQQVATRIREAVRPEDVVARFGGDEFVVLLPDTVDVARAAEIAAHVQRSAGEPVVVDGVAVPVSYSIGVAAARPGDGIDDLLARADDAVYRAKHDGGDAIRIGD